MKSDNKKIISMILRFGMNAGFVGGYFLGVGMTLYTIFEKVISEGEPFKSEMVGLVIAYPFVTGFFGIFFGLVPAILTGYCVAVLNINRSLIGYVKLFAIGAVCSGIHFSLTFMLIGGLSAMIVGRFALLREIDIEECYIK